MKTIQKFELSVVTATLVLGLVACSDMTTRQKDTAIGAGVGAVTGSVLTGGSAAGTVGGAAVGGVIGHEVGKDKKYVDNEAQVDGAMPCSVPSK